MSTRSLRQPTAVRRTAAEQPRIVTPMTVVDVVGYAYLDEDARQQREWRETIAARRAEFAAQHPFDIPAGRIVSGGAL